MDALQATELAHAPAIQVAGAELHGRIVIVSGSVGAGHDGVARELAARLAELGHDVEVLDLLQGLPWVMSVLLGSAYLLTLRTAPWLYGATCWLVEHFRWSQRLADAVCCSGSRWLNERVTGADLVVATYPPASRALGRLRERGLLTAPVATYLTDPAPNFLWVHPAVDLHLSAASATARQSEQSYGVPVVAAGPLVARHHRGQDHAAARAHLHAAVGAGPQEQVALVLLGSLGVGGAEIAARALVRAGLLPVVLCGRNHMLLRELSALPGVVALGWRTDTHVLLAGCDLVVHNAGGLALTEALVVGVPAVTFAPLPGHGTANARSLDRAGTVPWARTPAALTILATRAAGTTRAPWPEEEETAVNRLCALLATGRCPRPRLVRTRSAGGREHTRVPPGGQAARAAGGPRPHE